MKITQRKITCVSPFCVSLCGVTLFMAALASGMALPRTTYAQELPGRNERAAESSNHESSQSHGSAPAPHGGQLVVIKGGSIEVVYRPDEIRVYVYGPSQNPVTAKGVVGEYALEVKRQDKMTYHAFKVVPASSDTKELTYLAAPVDFSKTKDGELKVAYRFTHLPADETQAKFTQTFALSRLPREIRLAKIDKSDAPRIAKQKTCPVSDAPLDSMGGPVKVLVGDTPIYLCCEGCLEEIQQDPAKYLKKIESATQGK